MHPYGKSTFLVKSGLFRYSRNPIYLAFFIILFGLGLSLGSLSSLLPSFAFVLTMNRTFISYEEENLEGTFRKNIWLISNR
ncbi:methyltransferase [Tepidibacillus marianensis]|uniref:methyltransferase n=1 Tax=Tepidibacillus marianensis TaxID=3131995 RepID=UPI00338DEFE4